MTFWKYDREEFIHLFIKAFTSNNLSSCTSRFSWVNNSKGKIELLHSLIFFCLRGGGSEGIDKIPLCRELPIRKLPQPMQLGKLSIIRLEQLTREIRR